MGKSTVNGYFQYKSLSLEVNYPHSMPNFGWWNLPISLTQFPCRLLVEAIENGHLQLIYPLKMVIFHSYVSLPEGKLWFRELDFFGWKTWKWFRTCGWRCFFCKQFTSFMTPTPTMSKHSAKFGPALGNWCGGTFSPLAFTFPQRTWHGEALQRWDIANGKGNTPLIHDCFWGFPNAPAMLSNTLW